jgi:cation transport regulator ChaC
VGLGSNQLCRTPLANDTKIAHLRGLVRRVIIRVSEDMRSTVVGNGMVMNMHANRNVWGGAKLDGVLADRNYDTYRSSLLRGLAL